MISTSVLVVLPSHDVGYAQESNFPSLSGRLKNIPKATREEIHPSNKAMVCSATQKSHCQSRQLQIDQIKEDELFQDTPYPNFLVKTAYPPRQQEFLTVEIYVDREHRNFQDEIIEIFDQSLELQVGQDGVPLHLECHCDDREPLAYSYILGHRWGERAKAYLENLAIQPTKVEFSNFGNDPGICETHEDDCQDESRIKAAFRFLAIGKSHSGCLIRLQLPTQRNLREMVLKEHPLFLQEIHVAGAWARHE